MNAVHHAPWPGPPDSEQRGKKRRKKEKEREKGGRDYLS